MTFVAAPPTNTPAIVADAIAGDIWYPGLSIAAFRDAMRIGQTVTDGRAREALLGGWVAVEGQLIAWRQAHAAAGIASLAGVEPTRTIGGEPRAILLWRRAVHAYAAADLVETHNDISATADGRARAEERDQASAELLRAGTLAVRDLLGRGRSRVQLR